jgi:hypothetical protein
MMEGIFNSECFLQLAIARVAQRAVTANAIETPA